jgi:hypothetical protein
VRIPLGRTAVSTSGSPIVKAIDPLEKGKKSPELPMIS